MLDVWADDRGPFAAVSTPKGFSVFQVEGAAWNVIYSESSMTPPAARISGFPDGDLFVINLAFCSFARLKNGAAHCEVGSVIGASNVFVLDATLAYTVVNERVLAYDGSGWHQFGDALTRPPPAPSLDGVRLWASPDLVAVSSSNDGVFVSRSGGPFTAHATPFGDNSRAIWGFDDRLWIGGRANVLFSSDIDAQNFSKVDTLDDDCGGLVESMWGDSGALYIQTDHAVFRRTSSATDRIVGYPCDIDVLSIWGAPGKLYVAIGRPPGSGGACEPVRVDTVAISSSAGP